MFHTIPTPMRDRMAELEATDARDRQDGTPTPKRLRQIPPETGRFLALLAASAPAGKFLEVGTSAGYSGMWILLALTRRPEHLVTFEVLPEKVRLAQETFRIAGVDHKAQVVLGDVRRLLPDYQDIAFCFLDTEKELYQECYDIALPNLVPGGFLIADNVISHAEDLGSFIDRAHADPRLDAVVVPIGKGLLVCRRAS